MKRRKLVIISHTEHYKNHNQEIVGWGPTINEINFLADYWDEIVHIGCFYNSEAPRSALNYTKNNIRFVGIPPFGGKTISAKLGIFLKIPIIISTVIKNVKNASEVQLRLPTSMGLFLLPLFSFFLPRKYIFWVKYAGNWNQENPPISYKIQRWWLLKNIAKCKVTINGFWENQPKHCFSFENPCLTLQRIEEGKSVVQIKNFRQPYTFVFVGRLENAKGVDRILESFEKISNDKIDRIHFIGDGDLTDYYVKKAAFLKDKILFHGFLSSSEVHSILRQSHFFLLPSTASEGFPKVIAEAACYGTVPIVSNISSIPHYINNSNGFVWDITSSKKYDELISEAIEEKNLTIKSNNIFFLAEKFTFMNYFQKLENEIFNTNKP